MKQPEKYYTDLLYPFQDGILNIVKGLNTPFYLTGGTALSRHYFHHRFSDDLDLFVNNDDAFDRYVDLVFRAFEEGRRSGQFELDYERLRKEENYAQFFLRQAMFSTDRRVELKVDLINDLAVHYGDVGHDDKLGAVDSWRNILSNKLSAIFRYEAKDFVDIWIIAKNKNFNWKEIVREARTKEVGIDPIVLYEILTTFPSEVLRSIKWNMQIDEKAFLNDLAVIAGDIFGGKENTLKM